ncbi:hypothetical protein OG390_01235 [Streptomyces sp. NBC_00996]|nr:hypothetical protein OG390_01235 [Streptomyces sp. NBC_00996]
MVDRDEAVADIGLEHPFPPLVRGDTHCFARVDRGPLRQESVARLSELGLEYWFKDQFRSRHHHSVRHCGDRKRSELSRSPRFGNLDPPQN